MELFLFLFITFLLRCSRADRLGLRISRLSVQEHLHPVSRDATEPNDALFVDVSLTY